MDFIKLLFAAPGVQMEATVAATTEGVLPALLSGLQTAQAMARGDTAGANRAAAATKAVASIANMQVPQLQPLVAGGAKGVLWGSSVGSETSSRGQAVQGYSC
jgi:hypothetical protein